MFYVYRYRFIKLTICYRFWNCSLCCINYSR